MFFVEYFVYFGFVSLINLGGVLDIFILVVIFRFGVWIALSVVYNFLFSFP